MIYIPMRKCIVFILFFFIFLSTLTFFNQKQKSVFSRKYTHCIIIDSGHGFPDGGCVGMNGTIESTLNIKIGKLVEKMLTKKGYSVIMTRKDEESISKEGKTILQRKRSDMLKRLEIINSSSADMFISIHMNKFTDSRYCGSQVIYSSNYEQSEKLAALLQKRLCELKDNKSKRTHLRAPQNIFLLNKANIPAVIVECGFLSNYDEEVLLNTAEYQKALAEAIVKGIEDYYKSGLDEKEAKYESFCY